MSHSSVAPFSPFRSSSFGISRSPFSHSSQLKRNRESERSNDVVSYANAFRSLRLKAESQSEVDGSHSSATIKFSARAKAIEYEDGTIRTESSTKLKFRYSFETEDGTKITVRATAKLSVSQQASADGSNQSLQVKAKYFVGLIQDQVASGADGLTESVGLPESVQSVVAQAVGLFQQATDALGGDAIAEGKVDGDALITGLVDAFNDFATSFLRPFLGINPSDDGEGAGSTLPEGSSETPADVIESIPEPVVSEAAVPAPIATSDLSSAAEVEANEGGDLIDNQLNPTSLSRDVDGPTSEAASAVNEPANVVANSITAPGESDSESEEEAGTDLAGANAPANDADTANVETLRSAAEATLFRIRVSVIQSLNQLTYSLDSEDGADATYQSFFSQAKIDYRSSTFSRLEANAPLIGTAVDVDG